MRNELQLDVTETDISVELDTAEGYAKGARHQVASLCIDSPTIYIRIMGAIGGPRQMVTILLDLADELQESITANAVAQEVPQ